MLKRIIAASVLAASVIGVSATAASADTTPIPAPVGGTATLTVGDVQYGVGGGCVNTPVTVAIAAGNDYAYFDWEYSTTYSGPTTMPDYGYDYGYYSGTFYDSFLICPTFDQPGAYTGTLKVNFYNDYGYLVTTATATDAFTVSAYVPPAPPAPPAPPVVTPPAPPVVTPPALPVPAPFPKIPTGKVDVSKSPRKIALKFTTDLMRPNTVQAVTLDWKVKVDGKVRKIIKQDAGDVDRFVAKFAKHTGTHTVQVLKMGNVHKTFRITT